MSIEHTDAIQLLLFVNRSVLCVHRTTWPQPDERQKYWFFNQVPFFACCHRLRTIPSLICFQWVNPKAKKKCINNSTTMRMFDSIQSQSDDTFFRSQLLSIDFLRNQRNWIARIRLGLWTWNEADILCNGAPSDGTRHVARARASAECAMLINLLARIVSSLLKSSE